MMTRKPACFPVLVSALMIAASSMIVPAEAQLPQTRLQALSRAGGQAGQTFDITILAGADLDEVNELVFTHPGITAKQKTTMANGKAIPVTNQFNVTINADVKPGAYEVRCGGLFGYSNPRRFLVSNRPEVMEATDNAVAAKAVEIPLGTVVNGRMETGSDVDWFRLNLTKGQRLIVDVAAERIDSRTRPVIGIYDESGRKRFTSLRNTASGDAVLVFDVPADAVYLVKLHDRTFKSGNDYLYRLVAHTDAHIEFVHPPVAQIGTATPLTLYGYNLPNGKKSEESFRGVALETIEVTVTAPAKTEPSQLGNRVSPSGSAIDTFSWVHKSANGITNPVRLGMTSLPIAREVEPNDVAVQAQTIAVPTEIGGRCSRVEDIDIYRFRATDAGLKTIEVIANRMGSAVDPYLIVSKVTKKEDGTETIQRLAAQDDIGTNLQQNVFESNSDDATFIFATEANTTYEVSVRDRYWESRGDAKMHYRLVIRDETPDFRVVAIPSSPTAGQSWPAGLRKGDHFPFTMFVFRQDGFTGPVRIKATNVPAGVICADTVIGNNATMASMTLTTSMDAAVGLNEIAFTATAEIEDPALTRRITVLNKQIPAAQKPIPAAEKPISQLTDQLTKAQAALDDATAKATSAPDDAGLAQQVVQQTKTRDQAKAAIDAAQQKLDGLKQALAALETARTDAVQKRTASIRSVVHPVRTATLVWSTANNVPAITRLTDRMAFSVIPESAPFQIVTPVHEIFATQGQQVLIPVTLEKRNAFNNAVALAVTGMPKSSNVDLKNDNIPKDQAAKTLRMFFKDNALVGSYSIWLKGTGQVGYQRNPEKAARLKKEHDAIKAETDAANKASQAATAAKNNAVNALTQATQKQQQLQQALTQKTNAVNASKQLVDQSTKTKAAAATKVTAMEQAFVTTQTGVASSTELVKQAEASLQEAMKAEEPNAEQIKQLQQQVAAAKIDLAAKTKAQTDAMSAVDEAKKLFTAEETKLTQQSEALKKAMADAAKTQTELQASQQAMKTAEAAKSKAEADEKNAQAAAAALEVKRKVAEKASADAANAAKAKNINFTPPSTPIIVHVKASPAKVAAVVPNGGKFKRGATVDVVVKVTRQNGFAGPLKASLWTPDAVAGVTSNEIEIPADQTEGTITIAATGDATEGALANVVVRTVSEFDGEAIVDAPIGLTVEK